MIEFYWPGSESEWLAWVSAIATVVFGLILFFAPRTGFKTLKFHVSADNREALSIIRGPVAGFLIGIGACSILLAQPLIYLVLAVCWAFAAFGHGVSMLMEWNFCSRNWMILGIELILFIFAAAYIVGLS